MILRGWPVLLAGMTLLSTLTTALVWAGAWPRAVMVLSATGGAVLGIWTGRMDGRRRRR